MDSFREAVWRLNKTIRNLHKPIKPYGPMKNAVFVGGRSSRGVFSSPYFASDCWGLHACLISCPDNNSWAMITIVCPATVES